MSASKIDRQKQIDKYSEENIYTVSVYQICMSDSLGMYKSDAGEEIYESFLREIDEKKFFLNTHGSNPRPIWITIGRVDIDDLFINEFKKFNPHVAIPPDCAYEIKFFYNREEYVERLKSYRNKYGEQSSDIPNNRFFSTISNSYANRIVILANIVAPGFCDSGACLVKTSEGFTEDGESITTHAYEALFDDFYLTRGSWKSIGLSDVLKWSESLCGFWDGLPTSNIERAICYFSYLFPSGKSEGYFDTAVWAFGSLDAIYSDSHVATLEKLKRRTSLILREMGFVQNNKAINFLYNDRSRTFHGDMRFSANFSDPYRNDSASDRFSSGVYSSISTALFLLITTFRFAAERNINIIRFEENIAP